MQQLHKSQLQAQQQQHFFSASEVAEFEYCSLKWWHDRFEPAAQTDTEELFARLVELEHAEEVEQVQEEARKSVTATGQMRVLIIMVGVIVVVALLCIAAAIVIH